MLADLGITVHLKLGSDSTAAIAMNTRKGLGRAKHIEVQYLWAQEVLQSGKIHLYKLSGDHNRADLLTKHLSRSKMCGFLTALGYTFAPARPSPKGEEVE